MVLSMVLGRTVTWDSSSQSWTLSETQHEPCTIFRRLFWCVPFPPFFWRLWQDSSGQTGLAGHALVNLLGIVEPLPATAPPLAFVSYCSTVLPSCPCPGASQFDVSAITAASSHLSCSGWGILPGSTSIFFASLSQVMVSCPLSVMWQPLVACWWLIVLFFILKVSCFNLLVLQGSVYKC